MKFPRFVVEFRPKIGDTQYAHFVRGKLNHYRLDNQPKSMSDVQMALVLHDLIADGLSGCLHVEEIQNETIREVDDLSVPFP